MATDNLNQLGKALRKNKDESSNNTRRIALNFPLVERKRDFFGLTRPYRMEFFSFNTKQESFHLNIKFLEIFDPNAVPSIATIPITITETGNSVGETGAVGIQGIWYPLVYLGDLNFSWGSDYSVIFDITTYLTGTYEHKIVFDGGGVDLTSVTTITSTTITVPIVQSNVISPPNTILTNAYIYGRVTGLATAGWLHYDAATIFQDDLIVYTPRVIP